MLAGQEILRVLGHVPAHRLTLLGRAGDALLVTRVFLRPAPLASDALVGERVCAGRELGPELSPELRAALDGYRVRASLGPLTGLTDVVAAGVTRTVPPSPMDIAPPAADYGYAYVTTRFIEGAPLPLARPGLALPDKMAVLGSILRLLACLHRHRVVHGALGPPGLVASGRAAWLVDLAPLRCLGPDVAPAARPDAVLATDVLALGRIAAWLLEAELASAPPVAVVPGFAWWSEAIAACCREDPSQRPGVADLLRDMECAELARGTTARPDAAETVFVPDRDEVVTPLAADEESGARTVFVADEQRERPPREGPAALAPAEDPAAEPGRSRRGDAPGELHARPRWLLVAAVVAMIAVGGLVSWAALRRAEPDSPAPAREQAAASGQRPASDDDLGRDTRRDDARIDVQPRCSFRARNWGDGTLTITCRVANPGAVPVRARIKAIHHGGGEPRTIGSEEVSLRPGERAVRRFQAPGRSEDLAGSRCDCEAETIE